MYQWYTASGNQMLNVDELASNGAVHVVRSVLFPPFADLNATVHATPALRAATSLMDASNISFLFDGNIGLFFLSYTADESIEMFQYSEAETLTAFLPMDSPLLNGSLATMDWTTLPPALLLDRHVVRGSWFTSGLVDGDALFNLNGQMLPVRHDGDCIGIGGSCIVVRDITLTNGVLHVIDKLL